MDWELNRGNGTGKVSIIEFTSDETWDVDDADPLSQAGSKGRWLKSTLPVKATNITKAEPVTLDMLRELTNELS
jgi:hypothetical protein